MTAAEDPIIDLTVDSDSEDAQQSPTDSCIGQVKGRLHADSDAGAPYPTCRAEPTRAAPPEPERAWVPTCCACLAEPPAVKLDGCSHLCLCPACVEKCKVKECPICREPFEEYITLFFS